MYRQNFRSPNPSGAAGGGEGSPGSFRSPAPYPGPGTPMLPPPLPARGYGSPHTPVYGQRPYGSGGGHSSPSQSPYGGRYSGQSPGNTPPRRPSPRYNSSPYSKSPGGNVQHYQHHGRGYSSPRQAMNYQGSPRTSSPYGTPHGKEKRVSDVENYYRPSMLEDPWANLKPLSLADIDQQKSNDQTTYTGKKGRYFS